MTQLEFCTLDSRYFASGIMPIIKKSKCQCRQLCVGFIEHANPLPERGPLVLCSLFMDSGLI